MAVIDLLQLLLVPGNLYQGLAHTFSIAGKERRSRTLSSPRILCPQGKFHHHNIGKVLMEAREVALDRASRNTKDPLRPTEERGAGAGKECQMGLAASICQGNYIVLRGEETPRLAVVRDR